VARAFLAATAFLGSCLLSHMPSQYGRMSHETPTRKEAAVSSRTTRGVPLTISKIYRTIYLGGSGLHDRPFIVCVYYIERPRVDRLPDIIVVVNKSIHIMNSVSLSAEMALWWLHNCFIEKKLMYCRHVHKLSK
jgi:hypothetical protein